MHLAAPQAGDQSREKMAALQKKCDGEAKKRERNEKELKELNAVLAARQQEIKAKAAIIQQGQEVAAKCVPPGGVVFAVQKKKHKQHPVPKYQRLRGRGLLLNLGEFSMQE